MTKLLNKPLRAFAIYALVILGISIPVYVLVIDYIWISELDENNWLTLQHTKQKLQSKEFTTSEIKQINHIWGELQPGMSIVKTDSQSKKQDSIYEVTRPNEYDLEDEADRFRGLKSYVEINGQPYYLSIETNVEESDETFIAIAVVTFLFFIILILGFILLNRRIATKTWNPFYQTLRSVQSFELTNDSKINLPSTDIQEFEELNQSIEQLIKKNVDTYQLQKSFIENASHELQTPIALLKSKLDLLIQQKRISPEISEILNGIEAPLSRLSRINKNLLVLAKVENHQFSEQNEVDVGEYIESALMLFEDYIVEKQLQIVKHIQHTILVNANSFLLETLLHNILSNAIRHTMVGGRIEIKSEGSVIQVVNSGKNPLNEKFLFERFSNLTSEKVTSGLGLAIIKEIANKYHWQVTYHFENNLHKFSVSF